MNVIVVYGKGAVHILGKFAQGLIQIFSHEILPGPSKAVLGRGPGSISCGQYLDRTMGKFPPIHGPHLNTFVRKINNKSIFGFLL